MINENKNAVTKALTSMQQEQKKKTVLHENGVDLANYQNGFYEASIELLVHLVGATPKVVREYIEWWLLEDGDEITIDSCEVSVKEVNDFTEFLFTLE